VTPVVGIICDSETREGMASHRAGAEYVRAIGEGADALPFLIPVTEPPLAAGDILARVHGLLFTGAPSNVAPENYGARPRPGMPLDQARDATSLALLRAAIGQGVPVLCICRGFQELNVALGGTLDPAVHQTPGRLDHREDESAPLEVQYGPAHKVRIAPGGILAGLTDSTEVMVNSLHHQGIARMAPGLFAEAHAPDGLIEAVSRPGAKAFVLGVQWHPEWAFAEDSLSRAIFSGFGRSLVNPGAG
jgi:putative glutamine amidotransferase